MIYEYIITFCYYNSLILVKYKYLLSNLFIFFWFNFLFLQKFFFLIIFIFSMCYSTFFVKWRVLVLLALKFFIVKFLWQVDNISAFSIKNQLICHCQYILVFSRSSSNPFHSQASLLAFIRPNLQCLFPIVPQCFSSWR